MASTISAGTTSGTAIAVAGDTSGVLQLQTNGTTAAVSISTGQQVQVHTGGSASAPVISKSDDTNTGIFFPAADTIAFSEGGTESMRIDSSGNVLVGTTTQLDGALVTNNGSYSQSGHQMNYSSAQTTIEFVNRNSGGAKTFSWYYATSGGGTPATLSTSGVWTNASDARGKENITDINYGLDVVLALKPRQYDVKSDNSHAIGFVAQEVFPIIPELVHSTKTQDNEEYYGLDYGSMTAVLVKAIQELKAIVDTQATKIAELEAKLEGTE
jgi:hypothetical protein